MTPGPDESTPAAGDPAERDPATPAAPPVPPVSAEDDHEAVELRRARRRMAALVATSILVAAAAIAAAVLIVRGAEPSARPTGGQPSGPPSSQPAASTSSAERTTTSRPEPTTDDELPAGDLPGDLEPNVVEDECLLTVEEFETFSSVASVRAENTEVAGAGGRRSCFYAADGDDAAARIDVYRSASLTPQELVARIASNSQGARSLDGVAAGAVVLPSISGLGSAELVVATPTLLIVLTTLPDGIPADPPDEVWAAAATAMAARLPA